MKQLLSIFLLLCATAVCAQTDIAGMTAVLTLDHVQVLQSPSSDGEGGEGRWAIVTREANPLILAYGDAALDVQNLAPEFLYMLEAYEAQMTSTEGMANARERVRRKVEYTTVSPLLKTTWSQDAPFNDLCPIYEGTTQRCLTGCVATAMAQVLNFHKLPKTMRGQKYYYHTNLAGSKIRLSFDYRHTTFDWDNMKNSYTTATAAQKEAVATLMYACGVGASMTYHYTESGSNPWVGADAINCFMDGVRAEMLDFSEEAIISELNAGRPIIYCGVNAMGTAHCFVVDGVNKSGYYHCNLGWGPSKNGNFLPTNLGGYPFPQSLMRVYPSDERPVYKPIAELEGKYAQVERKRATSLKAGQWYVLWNMGRAGSPMSNGTEAPMTNTNYIPDGESTIYNAPQLVRLVPETGNWYYLQTGIGDYWPDFERYGGTGIATRNKEVTYMMSTIQKGYYSLKAPSSYVDSNGPGSTVIGMGAYPPRDSLTTSSWVFYPVTLLDEDPNLEGVRHLSVDGHPSRNVNAVYMLEGRSCLEPKSGLYIHRGRKLIKR